MAEDIKKPAQGDSENYSLNDDRRVKVLSPGALVAKRFFRNRIAMVGLIVLIAMFLFSFVGGLLSPYDEDQKFYRVDITKSIEPLIPDYTVDADKAEEKLVEYIKK